MKLHWSPRSPFVRKVMVAAHETGVADRIHTIRTVVQMGQPNPALLADNPIGKIPTLVLGDGTILFDSLTICEYLDHLGHGTLFPAPGPARWDALTRHALAQGFMDLLILWRNERDKPEPKQPQGWLDNFAAKTDATLPRLEASTPTTPHVDIGHVATACALSYLDFRFPHLAWRDRCPALATWHATFAARPSMQATEVVDA